MSSSRIITRYLPRSSAQLLQQRTPPHIIITSTQQRHASNLNTNFHDKKQAQQPQNSDHIDRQSYEYTQSSTDDAIANNAAISYERTTDTTTEGAMKRADDAAGDGHNPLEVSAANPEVSSGNRGEDRIPKIIKPAEPSYQGQSTAKSEVRKETDKSKNRTFAGSDTRRKGITEDKPSKHKGKILPGGGSDMMS